MDVEKLIEDLRGLLKQYGEKIPYGELVCAPWPYSRSGDLVWQDPEPYFIEQAATALSTLQAENEKLRNEVERQRRSADDRKHLYENAERAYMKVVAELEQVKRERDAAVDCIYQIEDDLDRGNDNDWAREHIAEWESQKEDGHGTALQNDTLCV